MCFGFIKSLSILLAKCLDIGIKNINIDNYIKEYFYKINFKKQKIKTFDSKLFYEEKIKEIKEKIDNYLKENSKKNQL